MLIELVVLACLKLMPDQCEERVIAASPEISLMTCMMTGQQELARWSGVHPHLEPKRWHCRSAADRPIEA